MTNTRLTTRRRGFTLLEVLVALMILAMGILGISAGLMVGHQSESFADRLDRAVDVGERELALAVVRPASQWQAFTGEESGLQWTLTYEPRDNGLELAAITIQWSERSQPRSHRMEQIFVPR